ncbi:MAG: UDP-N-acetylmuramoyl-tripeptide--D-alanyl-D-alanine ligase [Patescibacteria group bacterium]|nr:UDP-N-acetylmuramoyl-tripeptide--D-alanyl-D-alanine ligase [Patescibacteria group bacterium]
MAIAKKLIVWILTLESRVILRRQKPFVVAVTGSVGKTAAKDAIYDVLKGRSRCVRKSEKSLNSEIGLPLTVIGAPTAWRSLAGWSRNLIVGLRTALARRGSYPDRLVLEVGADHPGDIERVTRWLKPDIAVIARISRTPVHVEFFRSPEQVFKEKAFLAAAVKPGGSLVLYADDPKIASLGDGASAKGVKSLTYGLSESASVRAAGLEALYDGEENRVWKVEGGLGAVSNGFAFSPASRRSPIGMSFSLRIGTESAPVEIRGGLGIGYVYSYLAAAAVGAATGVGIADIAAALSASRPPRGRMNIIPGLNGSTLVDDTYNSSPDAAEAALEAVKGLECAGARIAVLGDMMELGSYAAEEHRRIGALAAKAVQRLYTVGPRSRLTADEALKAGMPADMVRSFDTADEAAAHVAKEAAAGDVILVKGSQSVRMERVSKALLAEPSRAAELLVRQEREWLEKK